MTRWPHVSGAGSACGVTPRDLTQPRAALMFPVLQVVNIPSFIVRLDSQKHIDFSLKSPFGGGR